LCKIKKQFNCQELLLKTSPGAQDSDQSHIAALFKDTNTKKHG